MSKVTVIGAGNVGATCANVLTMNNIADEVIMLDVREGFAEGKAMDMNQCVKMLNIKTKLEGVTNQYEKTANSDVVVITSGVPRKPGMTREELIGVNAGIVNSVCGSVLKYSPNAILVVIANPMDTMTYLTLKSTKLLKNRVIGMGGLLDSSRFIYNLSNALNVSACDIDAMVIGGHGDTTMIPLISKATAKGSLVAASLSAEKQEEVVKATMVGGATLTALLGTSAWYAPGTAGAMVCDAILKDKKVLIPSCVYLDGEYNQKDICIGVPAVIGKNGVEKIEQLPLTEKEQELFAKSAEAVRSMNNVLVEMKLV